MVPVANNSRANGEKKGLYMYVRLESTTSREQLKAILWREEKILAEGTRRFL